MKKNKQFIISFSILLLGILMFLIAIHVFTYQGNMSDFYTKVGEVCVLFSLPILLLGMVASIYSKKERNKK